MDVLAYSRAMAAFCRQRAAFEGEDDAFWTGEAEEWDKLISEYARPRPHSRMITLRAQQAQTGKAMSSGVSPLHAQDFPDLL
jgi:hypothetical protein